MILAAASVLTGWKQLGAERAWKTTASFRRDLASNEAVRLTAILTLYAGLSTCMLITLGKSGGASNYLVEWMGILSVLIGRLVAFAVERQLAGVERGSAQPSTVLGLLLPIVILVQVLVLPASEDLGFFDLTQIQQLDGLLARIRGTSRPVLSDDMVLLMKAGQEVPWEPAIFAQLASTGRWNERLIIDMIAGHQFAFVITRGHSGMPLYDSRYTPAVARAIETAYPRTEDHAGRTVHLQPELGE